MNRKWFKGRKGKEVDAKATTMGLCKLWSKIRLDDEVTRSTGHPGFQLYNRDHELLTHTHTRTQLTECNKSLVKNLQIISSLTLSLLYIYLKFDVPHCCVRFE